MSASVRPGRMRIAGSLGRWLIVLFCVGPTDTTVLITGESGTGKELVARALHDCSAVADKPFLPVNVAAIPGDVLESQLFGHARGAFTGATRDRDGILRAARGGTVFLDEIGELASVHQAKPLRALETHEVLPVGADRPVPASFRLLAATNQRLEDSVANGTFRSDLFYRLNVFRVSLPALRERPADIAPLAQHFFHLHGTRLGRPSASISNSGMRLLTGYAWPGNVRELSDLIERAVILAGEGVVDTVHLPVEIREQSARPLALRDAVAQADRANRAAAI